MLTDSVIQAGLKADAVMRQYPRQVQVIQADSEEKNEADKPGPDVWIGMPQEVRPQAGLFLEWRPYALGIGCRRGKPCGELSEFVTGKLAAAGLSLEECFCIASADLKKDEEGLRQLSERTGLLFRTFSAEELALVPGDFEESEFVCRKVGVGNVAERAAVAACGENGELVVPKQAENGMTLAVARRSLRNPEG